MIENYEYQQIINPSNLFNNIDEVRDFISFTDNIVELEAFLEECKKEELYEYCIVIKNKIDYLNEYRIK